MPVLSPRMVAQRTYSCHREELSTDRSIGPYCALCCACAAGCDLARCSLWSVPYITWPLRAREMAAAAHMRATSYTRALTETGQSRPPRNGQRVGAGRRCMRSVAHGGCRCVDVRPPPHKLVDSRIVSAVKRRRMEKSHANLRPERSEDRRGRRWRQEILLHVCPTDYFMSNREPQGNGECGGTSRGARARR